MAAGKHPLLLLEILGRNFRWVGRGWSDCRSIEADVNAPNDADRQENKHVDAKSPSDGEKARGQAAWIATSQHLATLPQMRVSRHDQTSFPSRSC
jgi:hypothetical protein